MMITTCAHGAEKLSRKNLTAKPGVIWNEKPGHAVRGAEKMSEAVISCFCGP